MPDETEASGDGTARPSLSRPAKRKLSIAMMIESVGLGGAEMVVLQLCEELRARGHTVHPVIPLGRDGWLLDQFRALGFDWHAYDLRHPIDLGLPRRLAAALAERNVETIHSHEFTTSVFGAPAARRLGVPQLITQHGNQSLLDSRKRRMALRWAMKRSRHVVAVSEATREHFETTLRLRPGTIRTIPNGIPERAGDRDRTRAELGVAPDEILLLAVGSLTERKGHAILLDALARVHAAAPQLRWRLAIAGIGPEQQRLEEKRAAHGFQDRVQLLGARNDVHDLQAAADIFVMPSLWEGLPLAILEAMFAGNAILASRTSGIPEAITDGANGLLVPPGDVDALAAALERLMADSDLRSSLGDAALADARRRFTIAAMTDAYEALY